MPQRVALILHKFSRGGSDRVAAYLARAFTDHGLPTELVVFRRGGEVERLLVDLLGTDIPIRYLGGARGPRWLDLVTGLPALVRYLRRARPDTVVSTANNTALVTAIACRLSRSTARLFLKTTNPIASSRHVGLQRWLRKASYRWVFARSTGVWTLSAAESAEMDAAFPVYRGLFHDVANPYVTPAMLRPPPRMDATRPPTVICIARLTAQKRLDRLIAAFALVKTPAARLIILGEGEDRAMLTAQIAALGLAQRVAMPGYAADVTGTLHAADLFVLTSDYEGLPAVLLEAMAANVPVLSTDCFPAAHALLDEAEGCGVIADASPATLATLIDAHLAAPRPKSLRAIAERYTIAAGGLSHIAALTGIEPIAASASPAPSSRAPAPGGGGGPRD